MPRRRPAAALGVALALSLGACATLQSMADAVMPDPTLASEPAPIMRELPPGRSGPSAPSVALRPPELAAIPVASRRPSAPSPSDEARRLIGLAREAVLDLLGAPSFVRREGPAQLWRYTGDDCHLDVFLFRERDGLTVSHVEARPRGVRHVSVRSCTEDLVATRDLRRSS
jgi:hypothetical protein